MKVKGKSVDGARHTLQRIRRIIGALRYHTYVDIQSTFKKQKERIGKRFEAIELELPNNSRGAYAPYQSQNLKAKWDKYMDDMFVKAKAKAKQYIDDGIRDLKAEFLSTKMMNEAKPVAGDSKAKKEERADLAKFQESIRDLEKAYRAVPNWTKPW